MKIALVGAGLAGKQHIHTILNNKKCKLDLIIDPSQEAYELSKKLNTQYFSNIEKALEKCRPDGVIIATPNSVHKKNAELFIKKKIPILGICLGMQLMLESSEEGVENGLGWVKGKVLNFKNQISSEKKNPAHGLE